MKANYVAPEFLWTGLAPADIISTSGEGDGVRLAIGEFGMEDNFDLA